MSRYIGIISGKGGVGKTTTAINIGSALNQFGYEAIVVDANISSPNMGTYLGNPIVTATLNDVIMGKKTMQDAIFMHQSGLRTVFSSISFEDIKNTDVKKLAKTLKQIKRLGKMIIIDGSSGQTDETIETVKASDEVLVVTTPDLISVTDTVRTIKIADEHGANVIGIVITMVKNQLHEMQVENIEEMTNHKVISVIPEDEMVKLAAKTKCPVTYTYPDSPAAVNYKKLAAHLIGQKYEHEVASKEERTILSSILGGLK